MKRSALGFLLLGILGALVLGCAAGGVVGKYKAEIQMSEADKKNPAAGMAAGLAASITLELKADNTFVLSAMMFPMEGTYTVSGDIVDMKPTKVMGQEAPVTSS